MKQLTFFLSALCLAVSCAQGVKYDVTGINAPDGAAVYLEDQLTSERIDSAVVSDGTFRMKGRAEKDAFLQVAIDGFDWWFMFFNDGTPVQVNPADSTLTGSELNNKLTECDKKNTVAYAEYSGLVDAFEKELDNTPETEQEAKVEAFMVSYRAALDKYRTFYLNMIEENKDNLVPVAFMERVRSLAGPDKFNEFVDSDAAFARHPYVQSIKTKLEESEAKAKEAEEKKQAIVGQKFLDLEEPDVDGNMHRLSEYVGQGRWVLVDFWASWCGPCKAEMPNVVNAYKKYHDKGFDVVGLSFDQKKEPWVKAITEWEMPWIHLSDIKYWDTVAREVYNVNSIPDNLLIDPEGTIVARGLRGEALEAKLAEVIE